MKFKLQLVCEHPENKVIITENIFSFDKEFDAFESIGMTLGESKDLLKNLQKSVIEKQLEAFIKSKICKNFAKKEAIWLN